jgi:hypothetical protein
MKTLSSKWLEQYNTVDPPIVESLMKYFAEVHMKLPVNLLKEVSSQKSLRNRNSSSELVSF